MIWLNAGFITLAVVLACASPSNAAAAYAAPAPRLGSAENHQTTPLILTAAPLESATAAAELYEPVAGYLGEKLGRPVVFRHVGNWGVYQTQMVRGEYDLVFDGPHFNGYRIEKLRHEVLVKLPGTFQFAIIARENPTFLFRGIHRMYGRRFCALAPPNLGTLILFSLYENPARQPMIVVRTDFRSVYDGVLNGLCEAGVVPLAQLRQFDPKERARVLYYSNTMPNQALSAGPRVTQDERARIIAALAGEDGRRITAKLRSAWGVREDFVTAQHDEYLELAAYLRNQWGFY